MELLELSEKRKMQREEAAELLHKLADSLARHNAVDFIRQGIKFHIDVAKDVEVEMECEIESDKSSGVWVLAPNSKFRVRVTPAKRGRGRKRHQPTGDNWLDKTPAERHASMTWMHQK